MSFQLGLSLAIAMAATTALAQIPAFTARTPDERSVLDADARQRAAVGDVDLRAITAIAHPNLRVNAPNNRILTREDLIRMVGSGEIRLERFERVPESLVITGDVAVVMGREIVYPAAGSEQARMYGQRILNRRYTNIFLKTKDGWRHLARHANVIQQAAPVVP